KRAAKLQSSDHPQHYNHSPIKPHTHPPNTSTMANSTQNTTCANAKTSMPSNVPTNLAYVALPNVLNFSALLSLCNDNAPVAEWGANNCYIYTNVTAQGQTHELVAECVKAKIRAQNETFGIMAENDADSGVGRLEMGGVLGKVVLAVAVVGAVLGGF
ncbi:hypothetical protein BDV96DRAFT_679974, partial [Lophiotrema nucula]